MKKYFKRNKECLAVIAGFAVMTSVVICGLMCGLMMIGR